MQLFAIPAHWDTQTCLRFNTINRRRAWGRIFAIASRLGDGVFWYALMGLLPVFDGWRGAGVSLRLALTGALGTVIYCWLKNSIQRPRPCEARDDLWRTVEPLDRFSFPSGHTLHALSFTIMVGHTYPLLFLFLLPFTILVACSRMVLGLHYPTDVLWGAGIGTTLALLSNAIVRLWG